jgi:preprotein translocase subunit YajC
MLIMLVLAGGAMWFITSRGRKQQREALAFRDNLQAGQEVQTASGMLGTVVEVEDGVVTLEAPDGSQTRWVLAAIARLVPAPVEDEDGTDEDVEDEWDEDVEDDEQDADEVIGTIEVPDDLSTLPPARGEDAPEDEDKKKK